MDPSPKPRALRKAAKVAAQDYLLGAVIGIVLLWFLPSWLRCLGYFVGAVIVLSGIISTFIVDWKPRRRVNTSGKAVVITGCDSGFGHLLAKRLDELGFLVFAGCLFPDGPGAKSLLETGSGRICILGLDVTDSNSIEKAVEHVNNNLKDHVLWAVVCNAGLNDGAELHWTSLETIQKVFDVNAMGVIRVTKAFLSQLCKSRGRVVAVASAAGRYTYPGMVPYCISKHAVVSFCDGLRMEMYRWGVQVVSVEPWMYKTNITNKEVITDYVTRTWERAPQGIKSCYPEGFLEQYIRAIYKFLHVSISDNPAEVVGCLEEAVAAEYPKYSYQPGTAFSKAAFWGYRKLPKAVADLVISDAFVLSD